MSHVACSTREEPLLKKAASAAYQSMNNGFKTEEAKPEELIALLFEKACSSLRAVTLIPINDLDELDVQTRVDYIASYHQNSGKVLQILTSLKDVVDIEKGGEVALQLRETYDVLAKVLWKSVKDKNIADMKVVLSALQDLRDGWSSVVQFGASSQEINQSNLALN